MIVILKKSITLEEKDKVASTLKGYGFMVREIVGENETVLGAVGSVHVDPRIIELLPGVSSVVPISKPYKLASRELKKDDTIVTLGRVRIGGNRVCVMAGPCAVENEAQLMTIAEAVKAAGATILRGGAYKPRTSPYSFQGLEEEGLRYMQEAKAATGLSTICEVVSLDAIEAAVKYVDMIQIGARNMQNFILLKEAGQSGLPVLLKRGLSATIDEWLNAAEYIIAEGNPNVVLCERGIRTFETATRNTLDLSAVPVLRTKTHLPVIVDPSHSTGSYKYVAPMAKAAVACDADGLMIEVHNDPAHALSDGPQSLTFDKFSKLTSELKPFCQLIGRSF